MDPPGQSKTFVNGLRDTYPRFSTFQRGFSGFQPSGAGRHFDR
jgi:hypothetical protein